MVASPLVFGWFSRKKRGARAPAPVDPIAAFDGAILSLERQGAEVRRSAAALLTLRAELRRDQQKYADRLQALDARLELVVGAGDATVEGALHRDRLDARGMLEKTDEALVDAERNATLLLETAETLGRQAAELKAERQSARARLSAGLEVSAALQSRAVEFDRLMKLDAARDEIERALALAELYREDSANTKKR